MRAAPGTAARSCGRDAGGWSDGSAAALFTQAASNPSERDRLDLARRAQEQLESDVVVIPLLERRHRAVVAPGVQGVEPLPDNVIDLSVVSRSG